MEKQYNPALVEDRWYAYWQEKKLFRANEHSPKPKYSIVIPPPNVTGVLHMGHALNDTLQDILVPLAPHGGRRSALDARHRPRGHRDAERRRAQARQGREDAPRPRPRGVHRRGVEVEGERTTPRSRASSSDSAAPATGSATASRWTRSFRAPCAAFSCSPYKKG